MRTIGVRDLKANLSRVLRDVRAGQPYVVTNRGRIVAELRGPSEAHIAQTPTDQTLARWATDGRIRLAERLGKPNLITQVKAPSGTAKLILDAQREER